jgi:hypothetical protein
MRVVLGSILAFVVGVIAAYIVVVAGGLWYIHAYNVRDRDDMSMAIMFAIGPLAGLIGGIVAAVIAGVWLSRRERRRIEAGLPVKSWPMPLMLVLALLAGAFIYFAAWGVVGLIGPRSYATYGEALAVWLTPIVLALATAGLIAWRALRRPGSA